MRRIDLHIHTKASDGTWQPEEVVENAKENNIDIIAITDHDDVSNVLLCEYIAKKEGVEFVRGVEMSCDAFGKEFHILGYDVNIRDLYLLKMINDIKISRENRDLKIIKKCCEMYDNVSIDEFLNHAVTYDKGGLPAITYLMKKGIIKDFRGFNKLKDELKSTKEASLPLAKDVVNTLKKAGAIIILAHPSYYYIDDVMPKEQLDFFKDLGIDGIECYSHYNHKKEQCDYYLEYCKENNLITSGGSDVHGDMYDRKMGFPFVDESMVSIIKKIEERKK